MKERSKEGNHAATRAPRDPKRRRGKINRVNSRNLKEARSAPKRHLPMAPKHAMSSTVSRPVCHRSSIAAPSVPVRRARRGCSEVHCDRERVRVHSVNEATEKGDRKHYTRRKDGRMKSGGALLGSGRPAVGRRPPPAAGNAGQPGSCALLAIPE